VAMEIAVAKSPPTAVPMVHSTAHTPIPRISQPKVIAPAVQAVPVTLPVPAFSLMPLAVFASTGALLAIVVLWLLIAALARRK